MKRIALGSRGRSSLVLTLLVACSAACSTSREIVGGAPPPETSPTMLQALGRDLGESMPQVTARLQAEANAARFEPELRAQLGEPYAGSWMSDDGQKLVVAITDAQLAEEVRLSGAEPRVVARSLRQLEAMKASLDQAAPMADASVHAWHVDVPGNRVVVETDAPDSPAVRAFVARAAADVGAGGVEVVAVSGERPRPLYDIRGGDQIILNSSALCSVGFSVEGGYVTAGHCGGAGSPTAGGDWIAQGTVVGSTFPGNDWAWVRVNSSWNPLPYVGDHNGGQVPVAGSDVAPINSSVCRSGRTSGWHCGRILAYNVTVNYSAGPVYGTTQTDACAEGGDSGGSFISGNQAQGTTSGGSGNCTSGGQTFFQPVNPTLGHFGLRLLTTGGQSGTRELVSKLNGKCIDVPGASFVDGARLQMWDCNGTVAQKWTFAGGMLQAGGKCMDVANASTADGTPVQLVGCNGNQAQQFVLSAAGDLVSVLANKCVDIAGWDQSSGAKLLIWPCHGGANQKWTAR